MSFVYVCDYTCRSPRCPAALERIAAGWRNGRDIDEQGHRCKANLMERCGWPECDCAHNCVDRGAQP